MNRFYLAALAALLVGAASVRAGDSVIDLHGPDGLAFSMDDPLRVQADAHNGLFFLSLNAGTTIGGSTGGDFTDQDPQIGFVNLTDNTVSRMVPAEGQAWEGPLDIEGNLPTNWQPGDDIYYAAGDALRHEINPASPSRDNFAVRLDPELFKDKIPIPSFLAKLEEIRFEGFKIDYAQVVGLMRQSGAYEDHLTAATKLIVEDVHVKIGGLVGFLLGGGSTWIKVGGSTIGTGSGGGQPPIPADVDATIAAELAKPIGTTGQTLASLGVTKAAVVSAARGGGDCNAVKAGLGTSNPEACTSVTSLVSGVKSFLDTTDPLNQANEALGGDQKGGLVQGMIDKLTRNGGWLKWKNPNTGSQADLVNKIVKNKLADEIKKFTHKDGKPVYSGAFMFNSLYMFGGPGRWIVETKGEDGLVESFVYARLGRIDPTQLYTDGNGKPAALWQQLDLITQKPKSPSAPLPWPPGSDTIGGGDEAFFGELNRTGAFQLVADEAGIGQVVNTNDSPTAFSSMVVAMRPVDDGVLAASFIRVKPSGGGAVQDSGWMPIGKLPLPPNYQAAGQGQRYFAVQLANRAAPVGPAPAAYSATPVGRALEYNWDFDADGTCDSDFGRGMRNMSVTGVTSMCYVVEAGTGKTGAGATPLR